LFEFHPGTATYTQATARQFLVNVSGGNGDVGGYTFKDRRQGRTM
jgi:hypothetical protein